MVRRARLAGSVRVAQIEKDAAVVPEHAPHLAEHGDERGHELVRRRLEAYLPVNAPSAARALRRNLATLVGVELVAWPRSRAVVRRQGALG